MTSTSSLTGTQLSIGGTFSVGKIYIKEAQGTSGDSNGGTITLEHNTNSADGAKEANSIVFRSATAFSSGVLRYRDDQGNQHNSYGRFELQTYHDATQTGSSSLLCLQPAGGAVTVGFAGPANETFHVGGFIRCGGYRTRDGTNGGNFSNIFNIAWLANGQIMSAYLYIDSTQLGILSNLSDYRIKRNIETQTTSALPRIMNIRPVSYMPANYKTMFNECDTILEGFIAHELAEVIPSAVSGEKDSPDQIQSLRLDALCSVLTKGIQELFEQNQKQQLQIDELQKQVAQLMNSPPLPI